MRIAPCDEVVADLPFARHGALTSVPGYLRERQEEGRP